MPFVSESSMTPSALVAAEIRAQLGRAKMTQTELADALHMPVNTLRRRLDGRTLITVDFLYGVADALDLPVHAFIPTRHPVSRASVR